MNFLATTPSSRLVIAAPSWVDARRYALVKLRPEVTVEPTTEPAIVTLTHYGNDFSGNVKKHIRVSCTCAEQPCAAHEAPETIPLQGNRHARTRRDVPRRRPRIRQSRLRVDLVRGRRRRGGRPLDRAVAAETWDTVTVWEQGESLYVGLGPEPE